MYCLRNICKMTIQLFKKRLACRWSGTECQMGSEIRKPDHLKTNQISCHIVLTIWNKDSFHTFLQNWAQIYESPSPTLFWTHLSQSSTIFEIACSQHFKWCLKTTPYVNRICFQYLNTGLGRYLYFIPKLCI